MTEQQIAAVKQALAFIEPIAHNSTDDPRGKAEEAITALRRALADHALDKMAENARELGLDYDAGWKDGYKHGAWASEQQPAEEPVAKVCHDFENHIGWNPKIKPIDLPEGADLYTCSQPAAQWVGLESEEIRRATHKIGRAHV